MIRPKPSGVAQLAVCLLCQLASAGRGGAQENKELEGVSKIEQLDFDDLLNTPITTASGELEQRSLAAATVFVITRSEIEKRGWRSLREMLEQVPGLYVVNDHVHPSVGVREVTGGFRAGTRIVKVMVDGYPVNFRPELNAFIGPELIPVHAIERVEVAKGPLSALYGANAFLATVNVITREPTTARSEASLFAESSRGSAGVGASAMSSYGNDRKGVLIAATTERIDRSGLRVDPTFPGQDPASAIFSTPSAKDISSPFGAFLRLHSRGTVVGDVMAAAGYQRLDASGEFQLSSLLTHRTRIAINNRWANLQWSREWADVFKLRTMVGLASGEPAADYEVYLTGLTDRFYRPNHGYRALNALIELGYSPIPRLSFKLGADLESNHERILFFTEVLNRPVAMRPSLDENEVIGATEPRSAVMRQLGAYLQGTGSPISSLPGLQLTGNARMDAIEFGPVVFPKQVSWRSALAYRWNETFTTKVIAGRAFQTPSGTLLFAHGGLGNSLNVIGSEVQGENLRPQTVSSVDVAGTAQIGSTLTLEATAFHQKLTDAIEFIQAGPVFVPRNRGSRSARGLELTVRGVFASRLYPYLVGDMTDGGWRSLEGADAPALYAGSSVRVGTDIELWRELIGANAELRWSSARGASQANVFTNGERAYDLPAYTQLDLTLRLSNLHLLAPHLQTQLLFSVRNALDGRRFEPGFGGIDVPQTGRTLFLTVKQEM